MPAKIFIVAIIALFVNNAIINNSWASCPTGMYESWSGCYYLDGNNNACVGGWYMAGIVGTDTCPDGYEGWWGVCCISAPTSCLNGQYCTSASGGFCTGECTNCPGHGRTCASGSTCPVNSSGSVTTGVRACFVPSTAVFTDSIGNYRFQSDCYHS